MEAHHRTSIESDTVNDFATVRARGRENIKQDFQVTEGPLAGWCLPGLPPPVASSKRWGGLAPNDTSIRTLAQRILDAVSESEPFGSIKGEANKDHMIWQAT